MRIAFDVRYISHGLTGGVRTYVYHLAKELPHAAPQHEFYFYADAKASFELPNLPANVVLRVLPWNGLLSSIRNDFLIGRFMERDHVDLVHCPGNYGPRVNVPLVVTLHDALNAFPMSQHLRGFGRRPRQIAMMLYLGRQTRATLTRASRLVTVSHHARLDIAEKTGYPLDRIDVTYEAASEEFHVIDDRDALERCRLRHNLAEHVILADGIKNPQALITAYLGLSTPIKDRTSLVFFSREPVPRLPVASALADARIRFIARPTTPELVELMNLATVFAFPSFYEGFGLPLVEAMRCGLPIVASSRASIPEIVGDAGLIFDLEAPDGFRVRLSEILENDSVQRELRTHALARAKRFNWQDTAHRTLAVYETAVALRTERCKVPIRSRMPSQHEPW
jgi:glycosyltransferase involved in cell wall biosynthesis